MGLEDFTTSREQPVFGPLQYGTSGPITSWKIDRDLLQGVPWTDGNALMRDTRVYNGQPLNKLPLWFDGMQGDPLRVRLEVPGSRAPSPSLDPPAFRAPKPKPAPEIPAEPQMELEPELGRIQAEAAERFPIPPMPNPTDVPPKLESRSRSPSVFEVMQIDSPTILSGAFSYEPFDDESEPILGRSAKRRRTDVANPDGGDSGPLGPRAAEPVTDFWPAVIITGLILATYLVLDMYEGPSGRRGGGSRGSYY